MNDVVKKNFKFATKKTASMVCGKADGNLQFLSHFFNVKIARNDTEIEIAQIDEGTDFHATRKFVKTILDHLEVDAKSKPRVLQNDDIHRAMKKAAGETVQHDDSLNEKHAIACSFFANPDHVAVMAGQGNENFHVIQRNFKAIKIKANGPNITFYKSSAPGFNNEKTEAQYRVAHRVLELVSLQSHKLTDPDFVQKTINGLVQGNDTSLPKAKAFAQPATESGMVNKNSSRRVVPKKSSHPKSEAAMAKSTSNKKEDKNDIALATSAAQFDDGNLHYSLPNGTFRPRNEKQKAYMHALARNKLIICVGPSGTGKTAPALARGLEGITKKRGDGESAQTEYQNLLLLKPLVPAGQDVGFLKGSLEEKLAPWQRSLEKDIGKYLKADDLGAYKLSKKIEFIPTNFLRGDTIEKSFVIFTEAQNATFDEIYMVAQRISDTSMLIIEGDFEQNDLKNDKQRRQSGLGEFMDMCRIATQHDDCTAIEGNIGFIEYTPADIVRGNMVKKLVTARHKQLEQMGRNVRDVSHYVYGQNKTNKQIGIQVGNDQRWNNNPTDKGYIYTLNG